MTVVLTKQIINISHIHCFFLMRNIFHHFRSVMKCGRCFLPFPRRRWDRNPWELFFEPKPGNASISHKNFIESFLPISLTHFPCFSDQLRLTSWLKRLWLSKKLLASLPVFCLERPAAAFLLLANRPHLLNFTFLVDVILIWSLHMRIINNKVEKLNQVVSSGSGDGNDNSSGSNNGKRAHSWACYG